MTRPSTTEVYCAVRAYIALAFLLLIGGGSYVVWPKQVPNGLEADEHNVEDFRLGVGSYLYMVRCMNRNIHEEIGGGAGFAICDTAGLFSFYPGDKCQMVIFEGESNSGVANFTDLVKNLPIFSDGCRSVRAPQHERLPSHLIESAPPLAAVNLSHLDFSLLERTALKLSPCTLLITTTASPTEVEKLAAQLKFRSYLLYSIRSLNYHRDTVESLKGTRKIQRLRLKSHEKRRYNLGFVQSGCMTQRRSGYYYRDNWLSV